jgi:hypothetical protein
MKPTIYIPSALARLLLPSLVEPPCHARCGGPWALAS